MYVRVVAKKGRRRRRKGVSSSAAVVEQDHCVDGHNEERERPCEKCLRGREKASVMYSFL